MVANYLKAALRSLIRHKGYALTSIAGLAMGMVCVILIGLYVRDEILRDEYHANGDRIYRVLRKTTTQATVRYHERSSGGLADALREEFPEVEQTVRVFSEWVLVWVGYADRLFAQRFCVADLSLLDVFDFPLVMGDKGTVLREPFTILLTEEMAQKYFGDADPMGKVVRVEQRNLGGDYKVVGVLKNIPATSSIRFDFMISPESHPLGGWHGWYPRATWGPIVNYVMLRDGSSPSSVYEKLPEFVDRHFVSPEDKKDISYVLQPYEEMYLHHSHDFPGTLADPSFVYGNLNQVLLVGMMGVVILVIACINFMNLATARSAIRAREVGVRKVVGAYRNQLVCQFLSESILLACIALVLALLTVALVLPVFGNFVGKTFVFASIFDWSLVLGLISIVLFVGVLAGAYPAFFLSAFSPARVLKGELSGQPGAAGFRMVSVVVQFAISIALQTFNGKPSTTGSRQP